MRWVALAAVLCGLIAVEGVWLLRRDHGGDASARQQALGRGYRIIGAVPEGRGCPECRVRVVRQLDANHWLLSIDGYAPVPRCYRVDLRIKPFLTTREIEGTKIVSCKTLNGFEPATLAGSSNRRR